MLNAGDLFSFIREYETRPGIAEEEKINFFLDTIIKDEYFSSLPYIRKDDAIDRYNRVKRELDSVDERVIFDNIYLFKVAQFLGSTKDNAAQLLVDYRADKNNNPSREVSVVGMFLRPLQPGLENTEDGKKYLEINKQFEEIYKEITRLNVWRLIAQEKDCNDDITAITMKKTDDEDKVILTAHFNNKNNKIGYKPKNKKK